ncbi:MAG: SDR family oxidoreductase [Pseudomonadota bacterium]|nr:SDR family oxidoreductase [Pseudomonadota bacterium]QKK04626.1 MAG: SDR family oxidoreductase [Pseudomonadota bacterium]
MQDLKGKKAIICGASKGIGRASAIALAERGATVTVLARSAAPLEDVRISLDTTAGQTHLALVADFHDLDGLQTMIDAHLEAHGAFHILVNNSGGPPAGPAHLADVKDFAAAFSQHVLGGHIMMQALLPGMKAENYGRIINIISTSVKQPLKGLGVSNTVRGAVANWAKTLAGELAEWGITVNNVLPGATDTDRLGEILQGKADKLGKTLDEVIAAEKAGIPAGRFGMPEELGAAVAFLASPAAAYINGINLPVDGGRTSCL